MFNRPFAKAMLVSGGLDSGATLHYLWRNKIIDLDNTLLLYCNYQQTAAKYEQQYLRKMLDWYQEKGENTHLHIMNTGIYRHMLVPNGNPASTLLINGTRENHNTIPWRNYLLTIMALIYCEHGKIEELYVTMGYHDDGGIWDNTPPAFIALQNFLDQTISQIKNGDPSYIPTRVISPTCNKSRKEWVKQEVDHGFPYHLTWSCWYYEGWHKDDNQVYYHSNRGPCGKCNCCRSRAKVLHYALDGQYPTTPMSFN